RPQPGCDLAADRGAAGHARDRAASHQPIPQPDQEFHARGWDRLSRSRLGLRRHGAEPDRAGDRDHRHDDGRLSADLAYHQRRHEHLWLAHQPEHGRMSDLAASSYVRQDLVAERPAPVKTSGFLGFVRTRLVNSPTNILLTILGLLLVWYTVVPSIKFLLVDAVWSGTDRTACL